MTRTIVHQRTRRRARARWCTALLATAIAGCSLDSVLGNDELPSNVSDPAVTKTPSGAVAAYGGTLAQFRRAFGGVANNTTSGVGSGGTTGAAATFLAITGLLSDELGNPASTPGAAAPSADVDSRYLPEAAPGAFTRAVAVEEAYSRITRTRGQAGQAIELLRRYAPDRSALAGHLYALEGYTEIFLAELFCSGIPLSTFDFDGDYTLRAGSSTQEVFEHALVLFDTALALTGDSTRLLQLAHLGRARALLNLGRFGEALAEAAQVPDGYQYAVSFSVASGTDAVNFARLQDWNPADASLQAFSVSDREGMNGLDFRTSNDPRTRVTARGTNASSGQPIWHPNKYNINGASPIVLADWIEARLIQAEGALQAGDFTGWLGTLNHLRQAAITPALVALTDPGTPEGRVDLLFRERAFWLFLSGHRQGDLRRLIRQYGRSQENVYPTGEYTGGFSYGADVTLPLPVAEREANPMYDGCLDRGA